MNAQLLAIQYNNGFGYCGSERQLRIQSEFERFIEILDTLNINYSDVNICYSNGISCYITVSVEGYNEITYRMSDHSNCAKWNQFISNLINVDDEIAYLGWLAELDGFHEYSYVHHFEVVDVIESELDKILKKHKGSRILGSYFSKKGNEIVKIERPYWVKGYLNSNQI